METKGLKDEVRDYWDKSSCGELYAHGPDEEVFYDSAREARYKLEPYIFDFARFKEGRGKDILEIGIGMGSDHAEWAKSTPRSLTGIDLTPRAVEHTKKRLTLLGFEANVKVADAEQLPFNDNSFDIVYSWGVLHHSPNTQKAIDEVFRVLRPGGIARIMIYHKYSLTGYMLWFRYGLLSGHLFTSLNKLYFEHLESPGTKAYSINEAKKMLSNFSIAKVRTQLNFADLLEGSVGNRHQGLLLSIAKKIWPRRLIKLLFKNHGLMLLIDAQK